MGKKMYYNEQEAAKALNITQAALTQLVTDKKLRVYADGSRKMFKAVEVEAIPPAPGPAPTEEPALSLSDTGEIQLTPADSANRDAISLDLEEPAGGKKSDTGAATGPGISIFDTHDLEVESADPMAKTSIAPSDDAAEAGGSGSGLLDLTREPDDTSLGAVLEDISVESGVGGSAVMAAQEDETALSDVPVTMAAAPAEPAVLHELDPMAGLFTGMATGAMIVMLILGAVAVAAVMGSVPPYVDLMQKNLLIFLAVAAVVVIIGAVVGMVMGKSSSARQAAMQGR